MILTILEFLHFKGIKLRTKYSAINSKAYAYMPYQQGQDMSYQCPKLFWGGMANLS